MHQTVASGQTSVIYTVIEGYAALALLLDYEDRCWIHDGITNNFIGLNRDLTERITFEGEKTEGPAQGHVQCTALSPSKQRLYWNKGKGFITIITLKEDKEQELADSVSDTNWTRCLEVSDGEEYLLGVAEDCTGFCIYDVKKQRRIHTVKTGTDPWGEGKVYAGKFASGQSQKVILVGDKLVKGKHVASIWLWSVGPSQEPLCSLHFEVDRPFCLLAREQTSGVFIAADSQRDVLLFRLTDDNKLQIVQWVRDVHADLPLHLYAKEDKILTCSQANKVTLISFSLD